MKIDPIPKELLIHSVTYREFIQNETWGETYKPSITLTNVLVQPATALTKDTIRETIQAKAILFYDMEHSKPTMPVFSFIEKSKIVFQGQEMTVDKVNIFYAFDGETPHHYEIELT